MTRIKKYIENIKTKKEKIQEMPQALRKYLFTIRIFQCVAPFVCLILLFLDSSGFSLASVGSAFIILVFALAVLEYYYIDHLNKFVANKYAYIAGVIEKINTTKLNHNGTKTQIFIQSPADDKYYKVFLKKNIWGTPSDLAIVGLPVELYAPLPIDEDQGIGIIYNYYGINAISEVTEEDNSQY